MHNINQALNILENYNKIETRTYNIGDDHGLTSTSLKNNFILAHFNIRSLHKHFDELLLILEELNKNEQIACIVLTETSNIIDIEYFHINGFDIFYNEGSVNKADGVRNFHS